MESLYYYADMSQALREIHRVLAPGGLFVTVVDLYQENKPSHQWIENLKVPVQLLRTSLIIARCSNEAGFVDVQDERILDPTPIPDDYTGGSFHITRGLLLHIARTVR